MQSFSGSASHSFLIWAKARSPEQALQTCPPCPHPQPLQSFPLESPLLPYFASVERDGLLLFRRQGLCIQNASHPAGPARGPSPAPRPRVTTAYHIGPPAPQSQPVSGGRPPWGSQATHKSAEVGFLAWCEFLFCSHHLSWQHPNLAVLSEASSW